MSSKTKPKDHDFSSKEKIKEAARKVFHKKGFAATRTRDIAEEAEINLALLNYYFSSKSKLFEIIMIETMAEFFKNSQILFNDKNSSFEQKIELFSQRYIDLLIEQPQIPIFILSEIRNNPSNLLEKLPVKNMALNSYFAEQYQDAIEHGKIANLDFMQFFTNLIGLLVFPFIAKPILMGIGDIDNKHYIKMMKERKKMVPYWIKAMIQKKINQ